MKILAKYLFWTATLLVVGCNSHIYRPYSNNIGYSEAQVRKGEFQVSFQADGRTSPTQALGYAILRCAELTILANRQYFMVLDNKERVQKETHIIEGDTEVREHRETYKDKHGSEEYGHATVYKEPDRIVTVEKPESTVVFRILNNETEQSQDAHNVINNAVASEPNIPVSNVVRSKVGLPLLEK